MEKEIMNIVGLRSLLDILVKELLYMGAVVEFGIHKLKPISLETNFGY